MNGYILIGLVGRFKSNIIARLHEKFYQQEYCLT